jgi:hypothetical protein
MPDFDKDDEAKAAVDTPRYCYNDHKAYWRDGVYVRARGEIPVKHVSGSTVYLCGRCYYEWLDRRGLSVMAQLRRDPDSIPAQLAAQAAQIQGETGDVSNDPTTN